MSHCWVLGSGGLLGQALKRSLAIGGATLFEPMTRLQWDRPVELRTAIAESVDRFASSNLTRDPWEIYWAAGVGTMNSSESVLKPETLALTVLLETLASNTRLLDVPGLFAFASSAGAIYAGTPDAIITEASQPHPTTPYANEKLLQEQLISSVLSGTKSISCSIARISTIYGSAQTPGKQQGLISHIARQIIRNQPIQIYVPFDTIRDYVLVGDAANQMVCAARFCHSRKQNVIQIIASERPTTIAEIISIFKKMSRRKPRIVTAASVLSSLYSRRIQFQSIAVPEMTRPAVTPLPIGIFQVMQAEQTFFARGQYRSAHRTKADPS